MSDTETEQTGELQGLSDREVIARRADGKGNNIPRSSSRPYRQILNENLFTFINAAFFTISLVMFLLGRVGDGIRRKDEDEVEAQGFPVDASKRGDRRAAFDPVLVGLVGRGHEVP